MEKIENINGYDVYLMSKEECWREGLAYPTYIIIADDWDYDRFEPCYEDRIEEFDNLHEARQWCIRNPRYDDEDDI